MNITAYLGATYGPYLKKAFNDLRDPEITLTAFSARVFLAEPDKVRESLKTADLLFIHDAGEGVANGLASDLENWPQGKPYLKLGHEPDDFGGNLEPALLAKASLYLSQGGPVNGWNFWLFLKELAKGTPEKAPDPTELPRFAFWHPYAPLPYYPDIQDYLAWYASYAENLSLGQAVGLMVNRFFWAISQPAIEEAVILALEAEGLKVLPIFAAFKEGQGTEKPAIPWIKESFNGSKGPKVKAIVKFISHFANEGQDLKPAFVGDDSPARANVRLFRELNVPVFQPLCSWRQSNSSWAANPRGVGLEAAWTITATEFEGAMEPFYVGGTLREDEEGLNSKREPQAERVKQLAKRVKSWVKLATTPVNERKVAFVLHNSPCASVEGTIGTALGLDATESLAQAAKALKAVGYLIDPPASGEELMGAILAKKAIADFRWTTVEEIVGRGGALALISPETYSQWFSSFPEKTQNELIETWGHPPGETLDEVPPAMVFEGKIVVSGLPLGPNAVVTVQPKRGCAGGRCDGRVCRILQDPLIPPPHQYLATYRWLAARRGLGPTRWSTWGPMGLWSFCPEKPWGYRGNAPRIWLLTNYPICTSSPPRPRATVWWPKEGVTPL